MHNLNAEGKVTKVKKLLVINGPNLNLLGKREPGIYGKNTLEGINKEIKLACAREGFEAEFFQSNNEGAIIDAIHGAQPLGISGIILNAGGFTHTSVALRDAVSAISIPVIEVHLSNTKAREDFRKVSLLTPVCAGCIEGFGAAGYMLAVAAFKMILHDASKAQ